LGRWGTGASPKKRNVPLGHVTKRKALLRVCCELKEKVWVKEKKGYCFFSAHIYQRLMISKKDVKSAAIRSTELKNRKQN
jgi:hypothetical protein